MDPLESGKRLMEEGISFRFNERDEFIKVAQRMYSENTEVDILVNPVFWDEDRSTHRIDTREECRTLQETLQQSGGE